jgi:hypothetical protein
MSSLLNRDAHSKRALLNADFPGEASAVNVEARAKGRTTLTARASHIIEARGTLGFTAHVEMAGSWGWIPSEMTLTLPSWQQRTSQQMNDCGHRRRDKEFADAKINMQRSVE